jgi:Flp pilus assembly protein TadG
MTKPDHIGKRARRRGDGLLRYWLIADTRATQIVEFAVALPLIAVFVVGIFDFGSAFTLKQKLSHVARDAARMAANQPSQDLSNAQPPTLGAVANAVGKALLALKVDDCGLSTGGATVTNPANLTWVYTNTGCTNGGTFTLTIQRGLTYTVPAVSPYYTTALTVEATRVTLSYPYKWQFNNVITLLVPGATYAANSQISSTAITPNLN